MDCRELQALLDYIDARIDEKIAAGSPIRRPVAAACEEMKDRLCRELGIDSRQVYVP